MYLKKNEQSPNSGNKLLNATRNVFLENVIREEKNAVKAVKNNYKRLNKNHNIKFINRTAILNLVVAVDFFFSFCGPLRFKAEITNTHVKYRMHN